MYIIHYSIGEDERLDAVLQIVDSLVDRVMVTGLKDGPGGEPRNMAAPSSEMVESERRLWTSFDW